jgi:hypothetical protein
MEHRCRLTRYGGDGVKVGRVAFTQSDCNGLQKQYTVRIKDEGGKTWMHRAIN